MNEKLLNTKELQEIEEIINEIEEQISTSLNNVDLKEKELIEAHLKAKYNLERIKYKLK